MTKFNEVYTQNDSNAEITAGASERFLVSEQKRNEYGSANSLIITSADDTRAKIYLDETKVIGVLQPYGSFIIKPEDGIYFDGIKIENLSGADSIDATNLTIRMARAEEVI